MQPKSQEDNKNAKVLQAYYENDIKVMTRHQRSLSVILAVSWSVIKAYAGSLWIATLMMCQGLSRDLLDSKARPLAINANQIISSFPGRHSTRSPRTASDKMVNCN